MAEILLTGGSGLLGKELQKYLNCYAPSHTELDITNPESFRIRKDIVIHAAAYTDVARAEKDKIECFKVNVEGTRNLVKRFPSSKFVYISSEYVKNPVNFYSWTKLWGENIVESLHDNYLIIRTLFKPNPWPFDKAFKDQFTTGDYVDVIAPRIAAAVLAEEKGIVDIGTGRKTMYDLAIRTNYSVKPNSIEDIKGVKLPKDYQ